MERLEKIEIEDHSVRTVGTISVISESAQKSEKRIEIDCIKIKKFHSSKDTSKKSKGNPTWERIFGRQTDKRFLSSVYKEFL